MNEVDDVAFTEAVDELRQLIQADGGDGADVAAVVVDDPRGFVAPER